MTARVVSWPSVWRVARSVGRNVSTKRARGRTAEEEEEKDEVDEEEEKLEDVAGEDDKDNNEDADDDDVQLAIAWPSVKDTGKPSGHIRPLRSGGGVRNGRGAVVSSPAHLSAVRQGTRRGERQQVDARLHTGFRFRPPRGVPGAVQTDGPLAHVVGLPHVTQATTGSPVRACPPCCPSASACCRCPRRSSSSASRPARTVPWRCQERASFKVSCGPVRRFGELDALLWIRCAQGVQQGTWMHHMYAQS